MARGWGLHGRPRWGRSFQWRLNGVPERCEETLKQRGPPGKACPSPSCCCGRWPTPSGASGLWPLYRTEGHRRPSKETSLGAFLRRDRPAVASGARPPALRSPALRSSATVWGSGNESAGRPGWSVACESSSLGGAHPLSRRASILGRGKPSVPTTLPITPASPPAVSAAHHRTGSTTRSPWAG